MLVAAHFGTARPSVQKVRQPKDHNGRPPQPLCQPVPAKPKHPVPAAKLPRYPRGTILPWPRRASDGTPLGIDLASKANDVRKIVGKFHFHAPGEQSDREGSLELEDLLQDVYLAIQHRNKMQSAFDPRKSSFGSYVYRIAKNVVLNSPEVRDDSPMIPNRCLFSGTEDDFGSSDPDYDVLLDIKRVTDVDTCSVMVGVRRCGHDATHAWLREQVFAVCREHSNQAPDDAVTPEKLARALAEYL